MKKIYRPSSQSYPYPRTHTLVVFPPSRLITENNVGKQHTKIRPPLNRAIPPIPESKSNDSIITYTSEKRLETLAEYELSNSKGPRKPSYVKSTGELLASSTAKKLQISSQNDGSSSVIEAHGFVTKTSAIISDENKQSEDMARSPLLSVAHSVRLKLTKLGNRFSRSDGNQNIRSSASLSSPRISEFIQTEN
ncbi:unnamed protein product [Litomosoides sigmodontis]|uniref:Uncharacterized protein n=1 Tax=Litomosoides sigmodontis TaxID=42156 RepID=A0A3P6V9Q5_LITSI|nr:unnamed protein product [Litomosoides sigmodontis]